MFARTSVRNICWNWSAWDSCLFMEIWDMRTWLTVFSRKHWSIKYNLNSYVSRSLPYDYVIKMRIWAIAKRSSVITRGVIRRNKVLTLLYRTFVCMQVQSTFSTASGVQPQQHLRGRGSQEVPPWFPGSLGQWTGSMPAAHVTLVAILGVYLSPWLLGLACFLACE